MFFLVNSGFCLGNLPWTLFLPSLFLIESWSSWSNFGRPATPGKVRHCSKFSPFVVNGSGRVSLESRSFRKGFMTLPRLIHVSYFVSHLFLN